MLGTRFSLHLSRRAAALVGLAVALPALFLAGLGIFLTLRVARAIENDSIRYDTYIALQVGEAFEQELMAGLRRSIALAENAARGGGPPAQIVAALRAETGRFIAAEFVPVEDLTGYSLLIVESQPLVYAPHPRAGTGAYFAGLLLRDGQGQVVGAGGWWLSPRRFLAEHLDAVLQDRLPANPRLYGGFESTRKLSVQLLDPEGEEIGRLHDPGISKSARTEPLSGPFERFSVRVSPTASAAVVWATNFVALEIARLEAGRRPFRFEAVDLLDVVRDALDSFRPRLEHLGFRVSLDLPESLPPVRGDATALSHCLLNLLDNAVKYSKQLREIAVSAGTRGVPGDPGSVVTVAVTDRGIGIAPEDQKRVFEKFVRLETGLVHDVKGAGLGLSLVDQIIRAHGGRVEVQSEPGAGSTFTIVLPVAGGVAETPVEPRRMAAS